jgi:hypothetical protein
MPWLALVCGWPFALSPAGPKGRQHSRAVQVKPFTVCFSDPSGAGAAAFACAAAPLRLSVAAMAVAAVSAVFDADLQRIGA